jgi:hypothetical protein
VRIRASEALGQCSSGQRSSDGVGAVKERDSMAVRLRGTWAVRESGSEASGSREAVRQWALGQWTGRQWEVDNGTAGQKGSVAMRQ